MLLRANRSNQWFKTFTWENGRGRRKDSKFMFLTIMGGAEDTANSYRWMGKVA